jgi:hypothetical protein
MKPRRIRTTLLAVAMAGTVPGAAHAFRIDYTIDAGVERDDNVTLTTEDQVEQTIGRVGLGFAIEEETSTVEASVAGRLDHRRYEEIYGNMTDRMLEGRVAWMAVPERLALVVEDSYGVQTINRTQPGSPDNRQQVNVLSLGPDLHFGGGGTRRGLAQFRYINSDAEVTDHFNSDRLLATLSMVQALDPTRALSWNARAQDVDFDDDLVARDHRRYEAFVGYRQQLRRLDFQVDLGYALLDYKDGEDRSNPLLRAELGWAATERSRFSLAAASQFSDAASSALARIGENVGVPPAIVTGSSTITPYAYEERSAAADYAYTGERFSASLHGFAQRLDYIDQAGANEKGRGIGGALRYRLRDDLVFSASADGSRIEFAAPEARIETDRLYSISLDKSWSRHWRTILSFTHYEREVRGTGTGFEQNVVYLNLSYSNR